MNKELIKGAIKLSKLLEHFSELDKVHVYIGKDVSSCAYNLYALYNNFRGKEKMFCIDAQHYVKYKRKYSDLASYNICFTCESSSKNEIIIDKSEIFSKHLINVILRIKHIHNVEEEDLSTTLNDWRFVRENIFQRRFNLYKKAHK